MQAVRLETWSERADVPTAWAALPQGGQTQHLALQAFKESCRKFYQAELEELAFADNTEECRKFINDWVTQKTEGERFHFSRLGKLRRKGRGGDWGCGLHCADTATLSPGCVCLLRSQISYYILRSFLGLPDPKTVTLNK